jgi:hypothetical protein
VANFHRAKQYSSGVKVEMAPVDKNPFGNNKHGELTDAQKITYIQHVLETDRLSSRDKRAYKEELQELQNKGKTRWNTPVSERN